MRYTRDVLALRQIVNHLALLVRTHEAQREPAPGDATPAYTDITHVPVKLALPSRTGWTPEPWLTVHVTAVTGGFGVARKSVERWQRVHDAHGATLGADARGSALLERYAGCAYHWIASRAVGAVRNHPPTLRTSHGNAGNKGLGWAIDCGHREVLTDAFVRLAIASLTLAILECRAACGGQVVHVVPHAVWSKKRPVDTDHEVWSRVVEAAVAALGPSVCVIDRDACDRSKGGRPLRELAWAR